MKKESRSAPLLNQPSRAVSYTNHCNIHRKKIFRKLGREARFPPAYANISTAFFRIRARK